MLINFLDTIINIQDIRSVDIIGPDDECYIRIIFLSSSEEMINIKCHNRHTAKHELNRLYNMIKDRYHELKKQNILQDKIL